MTTRFLLANKIDPGTGMMTPVLLNPERVQYIMSDESGKKCMVCFGIDEVPMVVDLSFRDLVEKL